VTVPTYRFYQLDVFTRQPLTGNPLAVFPDAAGLDPRTMQALARALGGDATLLADEPAPQVVSTAIPQLMVPISTRERLRDLPTGGAGAELAALLRGFGTDCAMLFVPGTENATEVAWCRMFAPGLGVPEDPATGSAAGALGAYLVRHGLVSPRDGVARITLHQGHEIGRPSVIRVLVRGGQAGAPMEVRVAGAAVRVIEGTVQL
jgi:trans-2,3-dihydro-3-hydroxyanthranilate isomerase